MSRQAEPIPLHLRPWRSRRRAVLLLLIHGAALTIAALLPLTWSWRLPLLAGILVSAAYASADWACRLPWSVREAVWRPDGTWALTLASGRELEARLLTSTYVSPALVLLSFRCPRARPCTLVLFADALEPNLLRRLRARLRLSGAGTSPESAAGAADGGLR